MEPLATIRVRLETAGDIAAVLSAAGEAFELIRAVADRFAVPGSLTFAAWGQVAVASSEGRDAVGHPPSFIPPELGGPVDPETGQDPILQNEDDASGALVEFVALLQAALSRGMLKAEQPDDLRAIGQAEAATRQIHELLS